MKSASGPAGRPGAFSPPQLDQIPRDEPGGDAQMAEDLHQQPGAVAARPGAFFEGFFGGLDARLQAGGVGDRTGDELVEGDEELDDGLAVGRRPGRPPGPVLHPPAEHGAGLVDGEVGGQLPAQRRVVGEGVRAPPSPPQRNRTG